METFLALIKIINPIEWLKECYKMPKYVKLVSVLTCVVIIFLPDTIRGLSIHYIRIISLVMIPILFISFIGQWVQEIQDNEQKKKQEQEILQRQLLLEEREKQRQSEELEYKRLQKEKETQEKIEECFANIDLCDDEEKDILIKFYILQKTSYKIDIDNTSHINSMHKKNIRLVTYEILTGTLKAKAITNSDGIKLINMYFDKDKENFFNTVKTLQEPEFKLIEKFYLENDNQIFLNKKQMKIAFNLSDALDENNFKELCICDDYIKISEVYLHYLREYFENQA